MPGYWMNETGGLLAPAVLAYLDQKPLNAMQVAALRAYLRQWIDAPSFKGRDVEELRRHVDGLTSREAIEGWLEAALEVGIDPL